MQSIIMPVYAATDEALEISSISLKSFRQTDAEIIIVDDASPLEKQVKDMVRAQDGNIQLIRNPSSKGYGGSLNRGAEIASGKYLILTNSDIIITRQLIPNLVDHLQENQQIGLIGPRITNSSYIPQQHSYSTTKITDFSDGDYSSLNNKAQDLPPELLSVNFIMGCFMAIRKDDFEQVNGIDEAFGLGYHEEVDLAYRLSKAGKDILVDRGSLVFHHGPRGEGRKMIGPSMGQKYDQAKSLINKNFPILLRKHPLKALGLMWDYNLRKNWPEYNQ